MFWVAEKWVRFVVFHFVVVELVMIGVHGIKRGRVVFVSVHIGSPFIRKAPTDSVAVW